MKTNIVSQPPEVVNIETMDANSMYYEFHFEPNIGEQHLPVMIFRAHTLGGMFYELSSSRWHSLRQNYVLAQIKRVGKDWSLVIP